jgi:cell division protein ZapA (FtsZ GTPase activity inhibitor)
MTEKTSKTIRLLGRSYVVNVTPAEEPLVNAAVELIERKLAEFKAKFKTVDDVDTAMMCCLDLAADLLAAQDGLKNARDEAVMRLEAINAKLQQIA